MRTLHYSPRRDPYDADRYVIWDKLYDAACSLPSGETRSDGKPELRRLSFPDLGAACEWLRLCVARGAEPTITLDFAASPRFRRAAHVEQTEMQRFGPPVR